MHAWHTFLCSNASYSNYVSVYTYTILYIYIIYISSIYVLPIHQSYIDHAIGLHSPGFAKKHSASLTCPTPPVGVLGTFGELYLRRFKEKAAKNKTN